MKRFVTFEGIDGSGKSTISKLVFEKLKELGFDVVLTFEPTDSWIGKCVQKCIESNNDPFVTAFTFIADRIEHGKQIKSWLNDGKLVICDRYAESTYAYQGAQLEEEIDDPIRWLKDLSNGRIPIPDLTFIFNIDPKDSLDRIKNRSNLIPFEQLAFLQKVHDNYLKLVSDKRFKIIDATKSKETLVDICLQEVLD